MNDKAKHILFSAMATLLIGVLFAVLFTLAEARVMWLIAPMAMMSGLALGIGKEYGDECSPTNAWDWCDVVADVVGVVFGGAILYGATLL